MPSSRAWVKMAVTGVVLCIGGPALVSYVSPSEEELFKRYNPDLQRRSLQNREERQQAYDDYVTRLKQAAKSDKPIWAALDDMQEREQETAREKAQQERDLKAAEAEKIKQEIRASMQASKR